MAITLETTTRQAATAAAVALANGGTLRIRNSSTTRVDIPLEAVAFDVASGVATARGTDGTNPIGSGNPLTGTSATTGAWDNYQVRSSADVLLWSGTSADLTLSTVGDTVSITSWTFTVPAS